MSTVRTRQFELQGSDGGPLRGEVRTAGSGADRPVVVICHGFKGFKDWGFFPKLAQHLARAGITSVSFNFCSSGIGADGESFTEPERFGHGTLSGDLRDLALVSEALAEGSLISDLRTPSTYGLLGHSRGGGIAILHAARDPAVRALVTWAAVANVSRWDDATAAQWRAEGKRGIVNARTGEELPLYTDLLEDIERNGADLDPLAAAAEMTANWLIVHGGDDETVPVAEARVLFSAAHAERTRLEVVEHGTHTLGVKHPWSGYTAELRQALEATVGWFADHLQ
jgi:dienelactone hydrolase